MRIIKLTVPFLLCLLVLSFSSCKKQPFEDQPIYLKILGKWQITKIEELDSKGAVKRTLTVGTDSYFDFKDQKGSDFERVINTEGTVGTFSATETELLLNYTSGPAKGEDVTVTPTEAHFREVANGKPDYIYYLKR